MDSLLVVSMSTIILLCGYTTAMKKLLLTVGNIYIDHNIFGVETGETYQLEGDQDYIGKGGERVLGGSAINVALQASRLGLEVGFIGKTGQDQGAEEVKSLLKVSGIKTELMKAESGLTTSMAVNLVNKNGQFIGIHYGDASKVLGPADIDLASPLFDLASGIYFGGTIKQPVLFAGAANLFAELHNRPIKIFYDPNRFPSQESDIDRSLLFEQLQFVDGYFPNQKELFQAVAADNLDQALNLALESGVQFVALKLGSQGCRVKSRDEDFVVEGKPITPLTTVGAGDCFNATFMAYYLGGSTLRECASKAVTASAIKVGQNIWPDEALL